MGQKLGQHFLVSPSVIPRMLKEADLENADSVLEIGPGKGILTEALLEKGEKVIAVEKDTQLAKDLAEKFSDFIDSGKLFLIESDIRDISPKSLGLESGKFKVVANIPYYITGEILRAMLTGDAQPKNMTLLVQKEVAERIATDKKESLLSLSVKAYGIPEYVETVPRGAFSPPPEVDSAILSIKDISRKFFKDIDEEKFFALIRAGFAHKRKKLLPNISEHGVTGDVFAKLGISENARAEDLPLEMWKKIFLSSKN